MGIFLFNAIVAVLGLCFLSLAVLVAIGLWLLARPMPGRVFRLLYGRRLRRPPSNAGNETGADPASRGRGDGHPRV